MFLPSAFHGIICMLFNILVFLVFAHAAVFSFTVDVSEDTSFVINLHRVALSRPMALIQCKFSVI